MSGIGLAFSHVGIHVTHMAPMEDFYRGVLEFTVTDRGQLGAPGREVDLVFLSRDPDEHHQIVLASGRPPDLPFNVINQLSLRADSLATLKTLYARLQAAHAGGLSPVTHGNALSVYARDPEGNRLELFIDLPWYVNQPVALPLDLNRDDEQIMADALVLASGLPGFRPRAQWRAEMARRMGRE
jgi:catechol-2,3-dioxygenase